MRALAALVLVLALTSVVTAQHKIPPLPDTAGAPKKLASGVTIIDVKVGTGVPAQKGRMVRIYFIGWVSKTEVMFDFRDEHTGPLGFHLGEGTTPVKGLEYGIYGMRVGGKRRLIIPPSLGHGPHTTTLVPPNSELTYDVELVSVARPGV
jgi:FKBP-type peptidyl-prolyl cis-trans isomerase